MTAAVQGFGNVGSFLAKFLHEEGASVVAISDSRAALYNAKGIDIAAAFASPYRASATWGRSSRSSSPSSARG
jgi:glutamate dehydrogenase/leucine dehydrogenase